MARLTSRREPGETPDFEKVSLDPSHWRMGRILMLLQGILIGALGAVAVGRAIADSTEPAEIALLGLRITLLHGSVLLAYGALACLASLSRRAALWFTALAASLGFAMVIVSAAAAYYDAPGPMGFDLRDTLLYAVLAAYNIALMIWLNADAIEGPAWVPRRRPRKAEPSNADEQERLS
ncbi:MAG: hypothetical protein WAM92_13515 [Mycobacterium sp.]